MAIINVVRIDLTLNACDNRCTTQMINPALIAGSTIVGLSRQRCCPWSVLGYTQNTPCVKLSHGVINSCIGSVSLMPRPQSWGGKGHAWSGNKYVDYDE